MGLISIQPLVDIITLTLQTGFIKNAKVPISLLLVSNPESAKTSTLYSFTNLDFIQYYDEITSKQLNDAFLPLVQAGKAKFLVIPDFINCTEKQRSTRNQFLAVIKSGIDDTGLVKISSAYRTLDATREGGIRFGMITAITVQNFKQLKHYMQNTGLLSRFIPFSYSYPIDKIKDIFDHISYAKKKFDSCKMYDINRKETTITHDHKFASQLQMIAIRLGQEYEGYGIRAQGALQKLAEASAMIHKRTSVNQQDIDWVTNLAKWMNYKFEVI